MTPKEKAAELYDKYLDEIIEADAYFIPSGAKKCTLIAVDEILKTFIPKNKPSYVCEEISYWQEVKQEIEKL